MAPLRAGYPPAGRHGWSATALGGFGIHERSARSLGHGHAPRSVRMKSNLFRTNGGGSAPRTAVDASGPRRRLRGGCKRSARAAGARQRRPTLPAARPPSRARPREPTMRLASFGRRHPRSPSGCASLDRPTLGAESRRVGWRFRARSARRPLRPRRGPVSRSPQARYGSCATCPHLSAGWKPAPSGDRNRPGGAALGKQSAYFA